MKKIFILLAFAFVAQGAYAQVVFNPKVGLNVASVTSNVADIQADGSKVGFNAGLDLRFGDNWLFFQPGIHYYNAGGRLSVSDDNNATVEDDINVRTIRIPLNAGFYLSGTDGILKVRINAGVVPSVVFGVGDNNFDTQYTDFSTFGLGANAGVGIDLAILSLDVNYELGLTNVYTSGDGRNNILSVSLGLIIPPSF